MTAASGPVLVTGAGGFIGNHVVRHLSRDPALAVVASTRDRRDGSRRMDLRDPAAVRAALAGVSAVVHCAVGDQAVTVDGTRTLLRAAAAAGVRRVVHFSSMSVYDGDTGVVKEDAPLVSPDGRGYAAWKAAAEQACLAERGVETVRLRPTIVYGPGSRQWVSWFAQRIRSGRWATFGAAGEGTCNLVHVADVASAVAAALTSPAAAGCAFNVNGPEVMTWNGWFTRLAEAIGSPPLPAISPAAARAPMVAALPVKALGRLRPGLGGNWTLGAPGHGELCLFGLKATYPTDAAQTALGWTPNVRIAEGLVDTVAWLRQEGLGT